MWTRQEIKERGKAAFRANYWKCVVASLLLALVTGASAGGSSSSNSGESVNTTEEASQFFQNLTPEQIIAIAGISVGAVVIGILIKIFLVNPLQVGCYNFFKLNVISKMAITCFSEYTVIFTRYLPTGSVLSNFHPQFC